MFAKLSRPARTLARGSRTKSLVFPTDFGLTPEMKSCGNSGSSELLALVHRPLGSPPRSPGLRGEEFFFHRTLRPSAQTDHHADLLLVEPFCAGGLRDTAPDVEWGRNTPLRFAAPPFAASRRRTDLLRTPAAGGGAPGAEAPGSRRGSAPRSGFPPFGTGCNVRGRAAFARPSRTAFPQSPDGDEAEAPLGQPTVGVLFAPASPEWPRGAFRRSPSQCCGTVRDPASEEDWPA